MPITTGTARIPPRFVPASVYAVVPLASEATHVYGAAPPVALRYTCSVVNEAGTAGKFVRLTVRCANVTVTFNVATEAGLKLASQTPFPLQYSLGKALSQLSEQERDEIALWMERMVELMGISEIDPSPMLEITALGERQTK